MSCSTSSRPASKASASRDYGCKGSSILNGSRELAVTASARGKACRARKRLAGCNDFQPAAHLVGDRLLLRKIPLPQCRKPVGAQAGLRETRDIFCQFNGVRACFALGHHTVGEADPQRLGTADRPPGENKIDRL